MQITDLKAKQGKVDIEVEVIELAEPREFNKYGKSGRVCTARVKDDSGEVDLTLWNETIDQITVGDMLKIENGYVSEYQGNLQLTAGKFGTMTVVKD